MKTIKKTDDYQIFKKRSGRFAVRADNKFVNGDDKLKILVREGLVEAPKAKEPEAADGGGEGAE